MRQVALRCVDTQFWLLPCPDYSYARQSHNMDCSSRRGCGGGVGPFTPTLLESASYNMQATLYLQCLKTGIVQLSGGVAQ